MGRVGDSEGVQQIDELCLLMNVDSVRRMSNEIKILDV